MTDLRTPGWRSCLTTGLIACFGAAIWVVSPPTQAATAPESVALSTPFKRLPTLPAGAAMPLAGDLGLLAWHRRR